MSAAPRVLPDMPRERETIALEKLALRHRLRSLVEHHDTVEATGGDPAAFKAEIGHTLRALGVIDALLNIQGG